MPDIPRRSLAAGAGLQGHGADQQAGAQQIPQIASATGGPKFRVQPLTFNPEKISGLSAKLIASHHDNNYAGAVKRLAAIEDELVKFDFASAPAYRLDGLKRAQAPASNPAPAASARRGMSAMSNS